MAKTSAKNVKTHNSRKKPAQKRVKRAKKPTSRDFGHAMLLTAILIAASAVISIAVLNIKKGSLIPDRLTISLDREDRAVMAAPESVAEQAVTGKGSPANVIHDVIPTEPAIKGQPVDPPRIEDHFAVPQPPQEKATAAPAPVKPQSPPIPRPSTGSETALREPQKPIKAPVAKTVGEQPTKDFRSEVVKTPAALAQPLAAPPELPPKPQHQGTLVFIIDDAGNNLQELEPFLRFPGPLTIAVLPGLPHSAEAARRIRAAGKEVFLHQPMEAVGGQNPGPGAIYADMNAAEILAVLNQNLAEVGPVSGMNNHQGSKITADRQMMETVLTFCREQGIYFLDSRTTAETAVPAAAQNLGITIGERNIFIDNEQNRPSMNRFIENGLALASQKGSAVMIGHTWSPELAPLLAELHQNFTAQGYTLSTASELINR